MTAHEHAQRIDAQDTAGNLPVQITQLFSRGDALEELGSLLWRTRLLTLCGPGGVGKSRLAAALADHVRADLIGGAWWVDLTDLTDRVDATRVAANTVPRENSSTIRRPPSRGIPGEQVWRVPGLTIEAGGAAGAVELFTQRAREAAGGFDLDAPQTRAAVAEICELLDGLPLAIELAAGTGATGGPDIAPILTPRELAVLELLSQGHTIVRSPAPCTSAPAPPASMSPTSCASCGPSAGSTRTVGPRRWGCCRRADLAEPGRSTRVPPASRRGRRGPGRTRSGWRACFAPSSAARPAPAPG